MDFLLEIWNDEMKKTLLLTSLSLVLSACSVDELKGFGAEILLPNSETASVSQVKRKTGLKLIAETAEIDQAYFRSHEKEIAKLLEDLEYYRLMGYVFSARGASLTQPIVKIDEQIARIQQQKQNYQAPTTYDECVRGADLYNGYGYLGSQCYESITHQYSDTWRKQETQRNMTQFNNQLASLQQERQKLISKAKAEGADDALLATSNNASQQSNIIRQKLNQHCNHLLKAPEVKWIMVENGRGRMADKKFISEVTARKGKDNCTFSVYTAFNLYNFVDAAAHLRFYKQYGKQFGIQDYHQMEKLIEESGYRGEIKLSSYETFLENQRNPIFH